MKLVIPSVEFKESFIEAVREFQACDASDLRTRHYHSMSIPELENDFESYLGKLEKMALGEGLPTGWVPATTYWLVDDATFIGSVNIRHRLTEHLLAIGGHIGYDIRPSMRNRGYGSEILRLALTKTKALGIERALVTCNATNEGSRKIIEKNGGVFESQELDSESGEEKLRYWIDLSGI